MDACRLQIRHSPMLPWSAHAQRPIIRPALPADSTAVQRLLDSARYSHLHREWRPVSDWIGRWPAYVAEDRYGLAGFVITSADPPPAAWLRAAAVSRGASPDNLMRQLTRACLDDLAQRGVETLSAMPVDPWLTGLLADLGFSIAEWVVTLGKPDLQIPRRGNPDVVVRFARKAELAHLARIDAAAFPPRWRYSAAALETIWETAESFTVAELDGAVVGFQVSMAVERRAHLARLTIHPDAQRQGVGTRLLADALASYAALGLEQVSLNTQTDNTGSHRLYGAFGFRPISPRLAVWEIGATGGPRPAIPNRSAGRRHPSSCT